MNFFKRVTGMNCRDCFILGNSLIFVAEENKAGLAVGKNGKNIQTLKRSLNKDVKIIEYATTPEKLAVNFVFPLKPTKVEIEDNILAIYFARGSERRCLLSDNKAKLNQLKDVMKIYYSDIAEITVPQ